MVVSIEISTRNAHPHINQSSKVVAAPALLRQSGLLPQNPTKELFDGS